MHHQISGAVLEDYIIALKMQSSPMHFPLLLSLMCSMKKNKKYDIQRSIPNLSSLF
jgi:hypothetical protein